MTSNARADDVFEYSVVLTTSNGTELEISELVHSVQIHQSIFSPAMLAKFVVDDRVNFINTTPIIGEEKIKVRFRSEGQEQVSEFEFAVVGCDEFEFGESLMELRYTLWGSSIESIKDYDKSVQKSYKTPVNEIVADIYTSYLGTSKTVTTERTEGRTKIIIPNLTPFQALSWLKKRAVSAENPTDVFMSYEDTDGFKFQTIANMIKRGKDKADTARTHRFVLQHSSLTDPSAESLQGAVIQFKQVRKFEMSEIMQMGYFAADVHKFNLDTAEMETATFVLKDKIDGWKLSHGEDGKKIHTQDFMAARTKSHKQYFIAYDPYRQETSTAENIAEKGAYLANLMQQQFEIVVPGAETLRAGSLIHVSVPEMAVPEASGATFQNQTNGYFLVGDLIHTISNRSKLTTKMVAFKDSYSAETNR